MKDDSAAWVVSAVIGVAFLVAAAASSGVLRIGWLVLGLASFPIAYLRYKAARQPND